MPRIQPLLIVLQGTFNRWQRLRVPSNNQVFVLIHFPNMPGEDAGEKFALCDIGVFATLQVFLKTQTDLFSNVGENIVSPQFL